MDTLVLHDASTIRFTSSKKGLLGVRIAYVGEGCVITSKGASGEHGSRVLSGANGADGSDLEIDIHFMTLGSLTLDTRGGDGGNGYIGKNWNMPSTQTTSRRVPDGKGGLTSVTRNIQTSMGSTGEPGSPGGAGGKGGDLILTYSTDRFALNFNHNPRPGQKKEVHFIEILYEAGKHGKAGRNGNSYTGSREVGTTVIPGNTVSARHQPQQNGTIKLVNANKPQL
ncbi:hypothetical protein [Pontibacter ummariensis]|uniref:hypothetical protein n=1 Tax=Pontibacter ummariensis TaxID=1610492 RepID=UPI0011851D00|nr:hypothetical protein [Pontibacter ummariensis]